MEVIRQRFRHGFRFRLTTTSDKVNTVATANMHINELSGHFFWNTELIPAVVHFFPKGRIFQIIVAVRGIGFLSAPESGAGK
ncbi:Uncharacterised protein [Salmonella enterica subsp. enterica serovar Bovismorbificans]|uniref:Uncharacterized protein n=1 Tax=Salmonella enterica subsp. enterica serovar Bovismorbificans TaxID=58097 RepID=A0A655EA99_SALET|nr:Uncharacterised protein [Salmonella enterica subsp. enterica serovar Bovismorbificans]